MLDSEYQISSLTQHRPCDEPGSHHGTAQHSDFSATKVNTNGPIHHLFQFKCAWTVILLLDCFVPAHCNNSLIHCWERLALLKFTVLPHENQKGQDILLS